MAPELRPYQERIVDSIQDASSIVKMPTGSGKTCVAAAVIQRKLRNPGRKNRLATVFLVPTCDLVEQQALVVERWCETELGSLLPRACVHRFLGGMADPVMGNQGDVLVSTPQAFTMLQARKPECFGWHNFGLCIFDEVHHILKDHPYRIIALMLKKWSELNQHEQKRERIQVLGLSASLTYQVTESAIRETLDRLCYELSIEKMESPSIEELKDGGYIPQNSQNVELELTRDYPEGVLAPRERKNHLMYATFMKRIKEETSTPFARKVWTVVQSLEKHILDTHHPLFVSPLSTEKLDAWETYAHHKSNSLELYGDCANLFYLLEKWYVGLRVLMQTWEEEVHLVLQWLKMNDAFDIETGINNEHLEV